MPEKHCRRPIQSSIDAVWLTSRRILDGLTFLSIRLYGIENCSLEDVQKGRYQNAEYKPKNLDRAKDLDALLSEAKETLSTANDRRVVVTDKCKTLLTLS